MNQKEYITQIKSHLLILKERGITELPFKGFEELIEKSVSQALPAINSKKEKLTILLVGEFEGENKGQVLTPFKGTYKDTLKNMTTKMAEFSSNNTIVLNVTEADLNQGIENFTKKTKTDVVIVLAKHLEEVKIKTNLPNVITYHPSLYMDQEHKKHAFISIKKIIKI